MEKLPAFADLMLMYENQVPEDKRTEVPLYAWDYSSCGANFLTRMERRMCTFGQVVVDHARMYVNDEMFRVPRANNFPRSDNGGIAYNPTGEDDRVQTAHGTVQAVYEHELYPKITADEKVPVLTMCEVEWKIPALVQSQWSEEMVPKTTFGGRAPVVVSDPGDDRNTTVNLEHSVYKTKSGRYIDACHVLPYNLVFWKLDAFAANCKELVVIARPHGRMYIEKS